MKAEWHLIVAALRVAWCILHRAPDGPLTVKARDLIGALHHDFKGGNAGYLDLDQRIASITSYLGGFDKDAPQTDALKLLVAIQDALDPENLPDEPAQTPELAPQTFDAPAELRVNVPAGTELRFDADGIHFLRAPITVRS
jgi:hypothetical protein